MDEFSKEAFMFAGETERKALCQRLAQDLSDGLQRADDFWEFISQAVAKLRSLGHDLWSMDASDDFEIWGPNYVDSTGPGILVTFRLGEGVEVDWAGARHG